MLCERNDPSRVKQKALLVSTSVSVGESGHNKAVSEKQALQCQIGVLQDYYV